MKQILPKTSLQAYEKAKPMIEPHHAKILEAIKILGNPIYEEIAIHLKMDKHQVGRRLKEMELKELVYKPGATKPTSSNRQAYCYSICDGTQPKKQKQFKGYKKGEKTSSDYSKELIQATKKQKKQIIPANQQPFLNL